MSEKRFINIKRENEGWSWWEIHDNWLLNKGDSVIYCGRDGEEFTNTLCDIFNDAHEKVEKIYEKTIIGDSKDAKWFRNCIKDKDKAYICAIKELVEKNKQLENMIENEKADYRELFSNYIHLQEENVRLEEENEQLRQQVKRLQDIATRTEEEKEHYADLYNEYRKKLECCKYEHFLNELDEIHEKVDKGDLSDFSPLKEDKPLNDYNPLKERLYYWQCKYYRRDYEHKMDMCTRCNYNGLLNYCLKDKCNKMVKKDYEVTVTDFGDGVSIGLKKW